MKALRLLPLILFSLVMNVPGYSIDGGMPVSAHSRKITGKIVDKYSGHPVEYTTVILKNQKDSSFIAGSVCDSTGKFVLDQIPAGEYFLEDRFIGYE